MSRSRVIVIGGGPAGATTATLVAQQGISVKLLERARFPRYHIGESLIPETYWVLERLQLLDKLRGSHFVKKHSVQFVAESGRVSEPFYFYDNRAHESSQTWQVTRSEFDTLMLRNAEAQGVEVREETRVLDVLFDGDRAIGVKIMDQDGETHNEFADVIVDASGQSSLIQGKLGLREWDPELKKAALWTYYRGARRGTGRDEGATLVLQLQGKQGWFWFIPLHDDIASVGVVASSDYLFKSRAGQSHEQVFKEEVSRCPGLQPLLEGAVQVEPFRAAKEYSYRSKQLAGEGWVLVGDAFGFLDPLYSSGVLLALKSGAMAADAVCEAINAGDVSAARLGKWGPEFVAGMEVMRRLVCEFYDGLSFGRFIKRSPQMKGPLTDLLIGDIFTEASGRVPAALDEYRAFAAANPIAMQATE